LVTALGSQVTTVAAPVQVYLLTESSLAVGLLGLAQLFPLILGSLVGGALADAYDRRKMLLLAQSLLASTSIGLALNAASSNPRLWLIYVLTGLQAAFTGIDNPTRSAATPSLVRREILPSALALNQLTWQICLSVGPALAGLLIARVSVTAAFCFDIATFAVAITIMTFMTPMMPEGGGTRATRMSVLEGLRYLKGRQALQGTFVIDINAMVFGMPRALFPALGITAFGGAGAVGLLYAAPGAGALVGAATSGWLSSIDRQGRAIIISVVVWGGAIACFGLSPWLWLACLLLGLAGAADVVSAVFRNSVLQLTVPDRLRGRLSAIHIAVVTGGPRLGDVEAGTVAALTSPTVSVVSGGLACMAGALVIGRAMPKLTAWTLSRDAIVDAEAVNGSVAAVAVAEPEKIVEP
jgi:MFS family permease